MGDREISEPAETQEEFQEFDLAEEFIHINNNCTLCGSALHFDYEAGEPENSIVEKVECPSCGLKGQKKNHTLN